MMKKVIALIRTSTDKQEVETQKQEVISMILQDGYSEDDIEIIGCAGASAIKLDDEYVKNLNKVYELIETGCIASVYAWGIDRIGRNEEVLMKFKNALISKGVQLVIKTPSLRLLNNDGTVNSGVELAFSLFATMAKQEMETKHARFHRGKKRNAEAGKYNGGGIPLGYSLDKNGYFIIDETEAATVRMIFEMMASKKYSINTLTEELRKRGLMYNGALIKNHYIQAILRNTTYIGKTNKYGFEKIYPRIISDELFYKVREVVKNNGSFQPKQFDHYFFATKFLRCKNCGSAYTAHHGYYICSGSNGNSQRVLRGQKPCYNDLTMKVEYLDGVLWEYTLQLHSEYLKGMNEENKLELLEEKNIILQKINECQRRLAGIDERFERLEDVYIDGNMTKERYSTQKSKINSDKKLLEDEITSYNERISNIDSLLKGDKEDPLLRLFNENVETIKTELEDDEKIMFDLVHKYIISIELEKVQIPSDVEIKGTVLKNGNPPKSKLSIAGKTAMKITLQFYNGETAIVYYTPRFRADSKIFCIENNIAVPFKYKPVRNENGDIIKKKSILNSMILEEVSKNIDSAINKIFNH